MLINLNNEKGERLMDETLDWMDEFDDSVFTDIIEANDSSALTGFENTETETETASPLEADETETETASPSEADETETTSTSEDVTQSSDDFFKYFTPTISRSAGPSSMNNNAHSKGDKPTGGTNNDDDDKDIDLDDYYGGGKTSGDDPDDQGGYGSNWNDDDDSDVDLDDYYGGGKTSGDDPDDDDYGSWTDKDKAEAAQAAAKAAGNEALADAAEYQAFNQNAEDAKKDYQEKMTATQKAKDDFEELKQAYDTYTAYKNGANLSEAEMGKAKEVFDKYGLNKAFDGALVGGVFGVNMDGSNPESGKRIKEAFTQFVDNTENTLTDLEEKYNKAKKSEDQAQATYDKAVAAAQDAKDKAQESFEKAQDAEKYAGTLASEAKEAFDRAKEKQKEWEQKQKELEAAEAAKKDGKSDSDNNTSTNTNSAVNNTTTFNLSEALAKAGAKMTETEYKQVADFVAKYPGLASFIDGGLTNVEKSAVGNVVAGIQAINAGSYLTAVKEFAQAFGMTLVSTFQLLATKAYGLGPRILGIIKSFMENENINYNSHDKDFETFKEMRDGYDGDSSELMALYKTAKGTTDQKQTFDYMKDNAATNVGEYNEGLIEDVNKVVSDASRKVIHYSPYVLEAVKKWR